MFHFCFDLFFVDVSFCFFKVFFRVLFRWHHAFVENYLKHMKESSTVQNARLRRHFFFTKMQLVANKGSFFDYFCSIFFSFFEVKVVQYFTKSTKKNFRSTLRQHFICLSHPDTFNSLYKCVNNVFSSYFFSFWCSIWRSAKSSKPCKCLIWTREKFQKFFACFYLFMTTHTNCCFPKFIYQVEKINIWVTCVEDKRIFLYKMMKNDVNKKMKIVILSAQLLNLYQKGEGTSALRLDSSLVCTGTLMLHLWPNHPNKC